MPRLLILFTLSLLCPLSFINHTNAADRPGTTHIAKWKDNKQAAFMIMFDDSCQSHVKHAIPELVKRKLVGTFYLNPGSGHYQALKNDWEKIIPPLGMEYANHTFTHKGAKDVGNLDQELAQANNAIMAIYGDKKPRLISFGQPGVAKDAWTVSKEELEAGLVKHHLVMRPNVGGRFAEINLKTADALFAITEKAIAAGSSDCVVFHGVGGDWLTASMDVYSDFLDKLVTVQDKVWFAGHIAVHCYQTERESAKVVVKKVESKSIQLQLISKADPAYYSEPLTLITSVPSDWTQCNISQGSVKATVLASDSLIRFNASPNGEDIIIKPGH
jgi:peptidoglycan/xylan/chitin deacetylase (PgdA/CDA1 family)